MFRFWFTHSGHWINRFLTLKRGCYTTTCHLNQFFHRLQKMMFFDYCFPHPIGCSSLINDVFLVRNFNAKFVEILLFNFNIKRFGIHQNSIHVEKYCIELRSSTLRIFFTSIFYCNCSFRKLVILVYKCMLVFPPRIPWFRLVYIAMSN